MKKEDFLSDTKKNYNGNLFNGGNDIDPATYLNKKEKEKELNTIINNYPTPKSNIEFLQEKRKRLKEEERKRKAKNTNKLKRTISILLTGATITAGAYTAAKIIPQAENTTKVNSITDELTKVAEENLITYGLGEEKEGKFQIGNNTVEDYSSLNANTPMEVFIYQKAIANVEEFEKFIQSVTYSDNLYCYTDLGQFLRINGYYDENGKTSYNVFENYMENALLEAYKNSTLSTYEEEFYTFNIEQENHKTR